MTRPSRADQGGLVDKSQVVYARKCVVSVFVVSHGLYLPALRNFSLCRKGLKVVILNGMK